MSLDSFVYKNQNDLRGFFGILLSFFWGYYINGSKSSVVLNLN